MVVVVVTWLWRGRGGGGGGHRGDVAMEMVGRW